METYAIIIRKTKGGNKFTARWMDRNDIEQFRTILRDSAEEALAEIMGVMARRAALNE